MPDLKQRIEEFAGRFQETVWPRTRTGARSAPALREDYWESLRELFTRDVTGEGFRELLQNDPRETLRYFTREIDFDALRPRPWYERYPQGAWRVFQALAFRLSPARRVLFAAAVPLLALGWLRAILARLGSGSLLSPPVLLEWMLAAGTVVLFLLAVELRDKLLLKGDLEIARQIQFGLLPFEPFHRPGASVEAAMRTANTVGGDYFDVIELPDARLSIVLGDVAGKGMPAALLMALLQGSLRTLLTAGLRGAALIERLNAHLFANIPANRLITLFYSELDPLAGTLTYVNAGHNFPYVLRRAGGLERLPATAPALGVVETAEVVEQGLSLEPGDRLFAFTDGVTEAFDPAEQEYGEERLERVLAGSATLSARALLEAVEADVVDFARTSRFRDDMTTLVLTREP